MIYQDIIKSRRASHYLMLLGIAHNPHTEAPKDLFESLRRDAAITDHDYLDEPMDKTGMEMLKQQLFSNAPKKVE